MCWACVCFTTIVTDEGRKANYSNTKDKQPIATPAERTHEPAVDRQYSKDKKPIVTPAEHTHEPAIERQYSKDKKPIATPAERTHEPAVERQYSKDKKPIATPAERTHEPAVERPYSNGTKKQQCDDTKKTIEPSGKPVLNTNNPSLSDENKQSIINVSSKSVVENKPSNVTSDKRNDNMTKRNGSIEFPSQTPYVEERKAPEGSNQRNDINTTRSIDSSQVHNIEERKEPIKPKTSEGRHEGMEPMNSDPNDESYYQFPETNNPIKISVKPVQGNDMAYDLTSNQRNDINTINTAKFSSQAPHGAKTREEHNHEGSKVLNSNQNDKKYRLSQTYGRE